MSEFDENEIRKTRLTRESIESLCRTSMGLSILQEILERRIEESGIYW